MALRGYRETSAQLIAEMEERDQLNTQLAQLSELLLLQRDALEAAVQDRTTDLRMQARELHKSNLSLVASNKELDDVIYAASHDLKEPLRGIRIHCDILRDEAGLAPEGQLSQFLDRLALLCDRMARDVDALASLSSIRAPAAPPPPLALQTVIDDVTKTMAATGAAPRGAVVIEGGQTSLRMERRHATKLLEALIDNGLRFNDSETPTVWISGHKNAGEPTTQIRVSDNGIGIPDHLREEAFRPFRKLWPQDRFTTGPGVGLTLVRRILALYGGRVQIGAASNGGCDITIELED